MGQTPSTSAAAKRLISALHRGRYLPTTSTPTTVELNTHIHSQTLHLLSTLEDKDTTGHFTLSCRPSPTALGDGVFIDHHTDTLQPGRVLAFFAGQAHLGIPDGKEDEEPVASFKQEQWRDNDKTMSLPNGGRINGSKASQYLDDKRIHNRLALGQLINHPNTNEFPNVMAWPVVINRDTVHFPHDRIPCILHDTWYYSNAMMVDVPVPDRMKVNVPCVVIVATRALHPGDELKMDYNLNSKEPWYVARNQEEDMESESTS